ncbi:TPA: glycosyltransferase [Providencia stuartii]
MKKIGILVPSLQGSGIGKVPAIHSKMFFEAGFDVDIITEYGEPIFPYSGKLINLKLKKKKGISKIINFLKLIYKIRKIKKIKKYDFFISHTPHCDIANALTKNREIVITTVHNNIEKKYSKYVKMILPLVIKRSDKVVSVSKEIRDILVKKFHNSEKIVCIYNPIDLDLVKSLSKLPLPEHLKDKNFILNVGRLDRQKGQWHLIKAFSLLLQEHPDLYLVLIGEGTYRDHLVSLVESLGIRDKVYFEGFQKNPYNYMKNASIFALPSLFEGLPLVLIEAMSCKTPIIATDCISGPKELLLYNGIEAGFLIPDRSDLKELTTLTISDFDKLISHKMSFILKNKEYVSEVINNAYLRTNEFSLNSILVSWKKLFNNYE